jgi:hypothetical protein
MLGLVPGIHVFLATHSTVILRSRALARRLEGWVLARVAHPSRLAVKNGEHLRMTADRVTRADAIQLLLGWTGNGTTEPLSLVPDITNFFRKARDFARRLQDKECDHVTGRL